MPADDRDVIREAVLAVMRALGGDADALKRLRRAFGRAALKKARKRRAERVALDRLVRQVAVQTALSRWLETAQNTKKHFVGACQTSAGPDDEQIAAYAAKNRRFRAMGKDLPGTHLPAALKLLRRKRSKPSDFLLGAVAVKYGISEDLIETERAARRRNTYVEAHSALTQLFGARHLRFSSGAVAHEE